MSGAPRPHPFDLIFAPFRDRQFPAIRAELGGQSDVNAFMLAAAALELMRELRPDDGLGDAVDDFAALVHAAYLFWRDGERTLGLDVAATRALCTTPSGEAGLPLAARGTPAEAPGGPARARYIQVAPHLIWARLDADAPFEPLDGWFALPASDGLRIVACLGVHPDRPGISVLVAEGRPRCDTTRPDGTLLLAPTMQGGDLAGLHAIDAPDELLLLGFRAPIEKELT